MRGPTIYPGNWIGVLGGGQLGRMFTHAAQSLGYHVAVFDSEQFCPAAQAADRHFLPADESCSTELLAHMSELCEVVTLEFENINPEFLRIAARSALTHPGSAFLELCQDRVLEKSWLAQAGFPTTPFTHVRSESELLDAGRKHGWPVVLKTKTSGYDGKGQSIIKSAEQASSTWNALAVADAIVEQWIDFQTEVSMIAARNLHGDFASYPLLENTHVDHILEVTKCPVSTPIRQAELPAQEICRGIAEQFNVVGLFCVEFFLTQSDALLINEIAPRPHNSGHLTIEAFGCSQFEQQVRAICNLPLACTEQVRAAAMVNLLGDLWPTESARDEVLLDWCNVLSRDDAYLHLYGKLEPRPGRKMGHITVLDESSSEAAITARELRDTLRLATTS